MQLNRGAFVRFVQFSPAAYAQDRRNAVVYLALTAMLMLVLWPLLLPAAIHGSHAISNFRRKPPQFSNN
jgi:hypothetical protein